MRRTLRLTLTASLIALCLGAAFNAQAQYKWRDSNGRLVYSDSPPPISVKRNQILQQPGPAVSTWTIAADNASSAVVATSSPANSSAAVAKRPLTVAEQEAASKKRQAEQAKAEETARKSAADAAAKQENCSRIQNNIALLTSGVRINNGSGGRGDVMDDTQRQAELQRARENLSSQGCQ